MPFNNSRASSLSAVLSILAVIFLGGCATQRWTDPLAKEQTTIITNLVQDMQEKQDKCPKSLDAEAKIFLKSPVADAAINGYILLASPSSVKFIVTNPLGMLAYAFVSDGKKFQILNTGERLHIRGKIRPLAIRKKIPLILAHGDWFAYLNQRLPSRKFRIRQVTKDLNDDSYWVQLDQSATASTDDNQWLHLDAQQKLLLGYLFINRNEEIIAEISYGKGRGQEKNLCFPAAESIVIDKLPWGSEIRIELEDIRTDIPLNDNDFILPVPVDYFKQIQP